MKYHFLLGLTLGCCLFMFSCEKIAKIIGNGKPAADVGINLKTFKDAALPVMDSAVLDKIAEAERSRGFVPGLGLYESQLREQAGDLCGATLAAFKEMAWAYALNGGSGPETYTKDDLLSGFDKIKDAFAQRDGLEKDSVNAAAQACIEFINSRYRQSRDILETLFANDEETDSFAAWMRLVCDMEISNGIKHNGADRVLRSAYSAIRARYEHFPAYWFYGAHSQTDSERTIFAERCINLAPNGPYSKDCRVMLANAHGLPESSAMALRTKNEIESAIGAAISSGDPQALENLIPLIKLPDNPYTIYAAGAMRGLASDSRFKPYLVALGGNAQGRLAERMQYILRG
jgi:hypothetical protein